MTKDEFFTSLRKDLGDEACSDFSFLVFEMFDPLFDIARDHNVFSECVFKFQEDDIHPGKLAYLCPYRDNTKYLLVEFIDYPVIFNIKDKDMVGVICTFRVLRNYDDFKNTNDYKYLCSRFKKVSD